MLLRSPYDVETDTESKGPAVRYRRRSEQEYVPPGPGRRTILGLGTGLRPTSPEGPGSSVLPSRLIVDSRPAPGVKPLRQGRPREVGPPSTVSPRTRELSLLPHRSGTTIAPVLLFSEGRPSTTGTCLKVKKQTSLPDRCDTSQRVPGWVRSRVVISGRYR